MNNTISLGNFNLYLESVCSHSSESNINAGHCSINPHELFIRLIPQLFKYYHQGYALGTKEINSSSPFSKSELVSRIESRITPSLISKTEIDNIDDLIEEVYSAYPESKAVIDSIRKDTDETLGSDIQAIPIIPIIIVYVAIFLFGVGQGAQNTP
jgi:hypothetical protein